MFSLGARIHPKLSALTVALMLAGCGAPVDDPPAPPSADGGGVTASSGSLTLRITDAPMDDADSVFIQVRGVQLQRASGNSVNFYYCRDTATGQMVIKREDCGYRAPVSFDLLALNAGVSDLLFADQMLEAGQYSWMRLLVDAESGVRDSYVVMGGAEFELTIPSNEQTGLKVVRGFEIPADGHADLIIDFDLRKSIVTPKSGKEYKLKPVLRLVDSFNSGSIAGAVDAALAGACTKSAVYAFDGANTAPDDVDGQAAEPVSTARVRLDNQTGEYRYKLAYLEPGAYSVTFVCQASTDEPDRNDALVFTGTATTSVATGTTTMLNLGTAP